MDIVPTQLGFSVADGEGVELTFVDGDLLLSISNRLGSMAWAYAITRGAPYN